MQDVCRSEKEKIEERRMTLQRLKGKQDHVLAFTQKVLNSQDSTVLLSCKKQVDKKTHTAHAFLRHVILNGKRVINLLRSDVFAQIHRQLQDLLEQTAFPMSTMMELYFHSNELNVKKVLKAFGKTSVFSDS